MNILAAFIAGLLSFFSPCVFPLLPAYIFYITGISYKDLASLDDMPKARQEAVVHTLIFILGFSLVFVALGTTASLIGQFLFLQRDLIRYIGATISIVMGLFVMGTFNSSFLNMEKKFHFHARPKGYYGSFLIGITFAAAWTPCVGPILASILALAGSSGTVRAGTILLISYSLGLAIPFFILALAANYALGWFGRLNRYLGYIKYASAVLLIIVGVLILRL